MGRRKTFLELIIGTLMATINSQATDREPTIGAVELNESDNQFFSTQHAERENWYSKTLDLTMHLWADLDMLQRSLATLLPDHIELIFNASLGKMAHLKWCLERLLLHHESSACDLEYLIRIIKSVEDICTKVAQQPFLAHRIESTQELLRGIISKIDTAFEHHESAITP